MGWREGHPEPAHELIHYWKEKLGATVEIKDIDDNLVRFQMDLGAIRLLGMEDVYCLLVGGAGSAAAQAARDFWAKVSDAGRMVMILAGSDTLCRQIASSIPRGLCLILSSQDLERILKDSDPRLQLKKCLWEQIPKSLLVPFDLEHPASGNMFVGRQDELGELHGSSSLAIAGPGRIGKTSLLHEYRRQLVRGRNPLASVTFFVDFYYCQDKTPDGVARFVAMKMNGTRRSADLFAGDLDHFLRSERVRLGRIPHLLLDEVDGVLGTAEAAFNTLGKAAREGLCRLILSGKGVLFTALNTDRSTFGHRLDLIRPEPLTQLAVRELALGPLRDLGFQLIEPERIAAEIHNLTGGLPQHVQFCGKRLTKLALQQPGLAISACVVEDLRNDPATWQHLTGPLKDLDAGTRKLAIHLLKQQSAAFSASALQSACVQSGLNGITLERATEIGDTLVILNFLSWERGRYRVANRVLREHLDEKLLAEGGAR